MYNTVDHRQVKLVTHVTSLVGIVGRRKGNQTTSDNQANDVNILYRLNAPFLSQCMNRKEPESMLYQK